MNKSFNSKASFLAITAFVLVSVLAFSKVSAQSVATLEKDCLKAPTAACAKLTNPKSGIVSRAAATPQVLGATTFKFTKTLSIGSTGTDVQQLQTILISEGFLKGSADGKFGKATASAVKAYQTKNGLTAVGIVGAQTRALLNK